MKIFRFRKITSTMMAIALLMTSVLAFASVPVSADATIIKPFKAGKYYFKYNGRCVCYSKYKNKGYKKTKVEVSEFVTNGKEIVYIDDYNSRIASYTISSKKTKTIKKLSKAYFYASAGVSGKYLLFNKQTKPYASSVYSFNLNNKKIKLVKKNMWLTHLKSNYYLGEYGKSKIIRHKPTEIRAQRAAVYVLKNTKLKKVKDLGKINTWTPMGNEEEEGTLEGNTDYVYYTKNGGHKVYRIKFNGKRSKLLKSFDKKYVAELFLMSSVDLAKGYHPCATLVSKSKKAWTYYIESGKQEVDKDYFMEIY